MARGKRRRGRPLLPGYRKLPGRAERYRTPRGKEISRRQYENRYVAATSEWGSWSEYQYWAAKPRFQFMVDKALELNPDLRRRDVASPRSEFSELFWHAKAEGWSTNPGGAYARMLELVGLRQPDASYAVGDTP